MFLYKSVHPIVPTVIYPWHSANFWHCCFSLKARTRKPSFKLWLQSRKDTYLLFSTHFGVASIVAFQSSWITSKKLDKISPQNRKETINQRRNQISNQTRKQPKNCLMNRPRNCLWNIPRNPPRNCPWNCLRNHKLCHKKRMINFPGNFPRNFPQIPTEIFPEILSKMFLQIHPVLLTVDNFQ